MNTEIKKETSCGVIVIKEENKNKSVLLVRHNLGHWGIPKGHIEQNETEKETAIREVKEETGISSEIISDFKESITYSPKEGVLKDVIFFLGKPLDSNLTPQLEEVNKAEWIDMDKVINTVTYEDEKNLLKKAIDYIETNNLKF